jgi:hypothetical protein
MIQRLAVDRTILKSYYVAAASITVFAAGCWGGFGHVAPEGMERISERRVREWVTELMPPGARRYDLIWAFRTQQGGVRGRSSVRFAPPDSIRFDYRGPFGQSGAAVVVGDSIIWAEPEEDVNELIPVAPLFWASLGIAREPPAGARLYGQQTESGRAWQYVMLGDTLSYVVSQGAKHRLQAEMRRLDQLIGVVDLTFADSTRMPERATLTFPVSAAVMQFTVEGVESLAAMDPEIWKRPR